MTLRQVFEPQYAPFVDQLYLESPVRLDTLYLRTFYEDCLYDNNGVQNDLYLILKDQNNALFYEGIVFDDLQSIVDHAIVHGDRILRHRVLKEFEILVNFLRRQVQTYKLYHKGILQFQSIDFYDAHTIVLSKINQRDVDL